MWIDIGIFFLGAVLLYGGAEAFIFGCRSFAISLGVSPLITGLTVVAFATSSPELLVSVQSALMGQWDLSLGNIVGSNIANLGLVMGSSALMRPIAVHLRLFHFDVPFLVIITILFILFRFIFPITRWEGAFFLILCVYYNYRMVRLAMKEKTQWEKPKTESPLTTYAFFVGGFLVLIGGARILVYGATSIAEQLGLSEGFVGLTIVALGTSLPEWATSFVGSLRKQGDLVVGNILGSNVYNILAIFGLAALLSPGDPISFGIIPYFALLFFTLFSLPLLRTGYSVNRWEGGSLVLFYFGYVFIQYMWPGA